MTHSSTYRPLVWLPNMVTIVRIIAGFALFARIFYDGKITVLRIACFTAIALTDWVDGWLARKIQARTAWGQLLDPIADKVVLLAAFGYFWFTGHISLWFTLLYFVREIVQTGLRVVFFAKNKNAQTPTLYISKLKTALSYCYALLLFLEQVNDFLPVPYWQVPVHPGFELVIIFLSYAGLVKPFLKK